MKAEIYLKRCIELAEKGLGYTAPNPLVGCVIVHGNKIIGEGYHHEYGGPHAEVNAIHSVHDKSLLEKSTLYVNLEPCSHFGKTPPCADLILNMKIPEVVIGTEDPNIIVKGKGIKKLLDAGIKVKSGILESSCMELNKRFFTFHQRKRPYIILKWAMTSDGFIDMERKNGEIPRIKWITDEKLRPLVHKWRSEEQAIMAGTNTVLLDNPQLTTRFWNGKHPVRIVLDRKLRLPETLHVFNGTVKTLVFTGISKENFNNVEYISIHFSKNIVQQICDELYLRNIQSVIVEGGAMLLQTFIDNSIWDEARVFTGSIEFGKGVKAPVLYAKVNEEIMFEKDVLQVYKNHY
ncbi:MAG: bifunctional diaminohydroxyphosphoribosylaminopyrimidine deaminase/5-amino-6-(5-phosphoribosylamino)uracil reductase RibD [Bacteroidota bacterium]